MRLQQVSSSRRAAVLIAVLIVVVLLSLAAYKYNDLMSAENRASYSALRAAQARAYAVSGIHYTAALLSTNLDESVSGNPFDNVSVFQNIQVPSGDQNDKPGRFSIVSLVAADDTISAGSSFRFGLCDESAKINVNALLALDKGKGEKGKAILLGLPNMTEDVAESILDWIDPNDPKRTNGAKDTYYTGLNPPYHCKNGPLDSLDEMLLIKGVTPQLLFGMDKNRNGMADPDEEGAVQGDQGWSAYLTVYSREANFSSMNTPRIYLNDDDLDTMVTGLTPVLGEDLTNFIVAARLYGSSAATTSSSSGSSGSSAAKTVAPADLSAVQSQIQTDRSSGTKKMKKIKTLWDLVNATVSVKVGTGSTAKTVSYPSPISTADQQRDLLPKLLDNCSTTESLDLAPRLNINTATPTVIGALKDAFSITDADIQKITDMRPSPQDMSSQPIYKTPAWLLTEANLDIKIIKKLDPFITTRSQVYRFQSIGTTGSSGTTARIEAVVDANQGRPRVVYFRDLSELGKGFDIPSAE